LTSPWAVAAVVAVTYLLLVSGGLGRNPYEFVHIGSNFLHQSTSSSVIKPSLPTDRKIGYDGQFYYFLAVDPKHGHDYMEYPGVIYSRIGYPMTVRALSGGNTSLVPYVMMFVNIAAAVGGTLAVAFFLRRRGLPPLIAVLYGLFPGLVMAVLRDLTEPLAFALAAAGLVVFDSRSNRRVLGSACLFALAMLTRETVAVFAGILTVALLLGAGTAVSTWRDRVRLANVVRAIAFGTIAIAPLFVWRHIVEIWLSHPATQERPAGGPAGGMLYSLVPFHAVASQHLAGDLVTNVLSVVVPALLWAGFAIALLRRRRSVAPWFVIANVLVFVVFLPTPIAVDYGSFGRAAIGIVLSVLVLLPQVRDSLAERWTTAQRALALWSAPYYLVLAILLNALGPKFVW
jgi:hypothetical protein